MPDSIADMSHVVICSIILFTDVSKSAVDSAELVKKEHLGICMIEGDG